MSGAPPSTPAPHRFILSNNKRQGSSTQAQAQAGQPHPQQFLSPAASQFQHAGGSGGGGIPEQFRATPRFSLPSTPGGRSLAAAAAGSSSSSFYRAAQRQPPPFSTPSLGGGGGGAGGAGYYCSSSARRRGGQRHGENIESSPPQPPPRASSEGHRRRRRSGRAVPEVEDYSSASASSGSESGSSSPPSAAAGDRRSPKRRRLSGTPDVVTSSRSHPEAEDTDMLVYRDPVGEILMSDGDLGGDHPSSAPETVERHQTGSFRDDMGGEEDGQQRERQQQQQHRLAITTPHKYSHHHRHHHHHHGQDHPKFHKPPRFKAPEGSDTAIAQWEQQQARCQLPEAFSPHRRGARYAPGGLAAELRDWLFQVKSGGDFEGSFAGAAEAMDTGVAGGGPGAQGGTQHAVRIDVEEVRGGSGMWLVKGRRPVRDDAGISAVGAHVEGEALPPPARVPPPPPAPPSAEDRGLQVILAGEGRITGLMRPSTVVSGSVVGVFQPVWDITLPDLGRWVVACDWCVS